jgi:hypothetical protein
MIYNNNYNFYKFSQKDLKIDYLLYTYGELLYNDILVKVDRFKKKYVLSTTKYISFY